MLKQRVITALVLLSMLLPALFYRTPTPFCLLALVLIAAGAWEWGRLNALGQMASIGLAVLCVMACALSWYGGLLEKSLPILWAAAGSLASARSSKSIVGDGATSASSWPFSFLRTALVVGR